MWFEAVPNNTNNIVYQSILFSVVVTLFVILACFTLINFIAGVLLIVGVRQVNMKTIQLKWIVFIDNLRNNLQSNHNKMIFMMVLMILGIISSFGNFYNATTADIVSVIIGVCIQIYFFLCVLSLYNKIKERAVTQKEQQPA